jgi:hypothetical protein
MATRTINAETNVQGADPIKHRYGVIDVAAVAHNATLATSDVIDIREFEAIAVKPQTAGTTSLSVHAAETPGGTFVLVDSIGTNGAVTVVASKWNVLDVTKIKPFGYIKFLANQADTVSVVGKT